MGGRGSSSMSGGGSVSSVVDSVVASKIPVRASSSSLADGIPDWVLSQKLSSGERYAWSVGDGPYVKRETEKAYLFGNKSDFGEVTVWVPKSQMQSPKQIADSQRRSTANLVKGVLYNSYLKETAASNGVKLGSTRSTDSISKKLRSKNISFKTKDSFIATERVTRKQVERAYADAMRY